MCESRFTGVLLHALYDVYSFIVCIDSAFLHEFQRYTDYCRLIPRRFCIFRM